jgi:hypothetical protein
MMELSVNGGEQVLACEMGGQVITQQLAHGLAGFNRARGMVGLKQHVVEIKEGWIKIGFALKHIKGCST